jgi:hypothetical protein
MLKASTTNLKALVPRSSRIWGKMTSEKDLPWPSIYRNKEGVREGVSGVVKRQTVVELDCDACLPQCPRVTFFISILSFCGTGSSKSTRFPEGLLLGNRLKPSHPRSFGGFTKLRKIAKSIVRMKGCIIVSSIFEESFRIPVSEADEGEWWGFLRCFTDPGKYDYRNDACGLQ